METQEELRDELKDVSFGHVAQKKDKVPAGYFDSFPDQVMHRWFQEKEQIHQVNRRSMVRRMVATAAIVSGICLGIALWTNKASSISQLDTISSGDAYHYIMENIDEFAPLFLQHEPWSDASNMIMPDSSSIEQYLMEELDGEEFESIF